MHIVFVMTKKKIAWPETKDRKEPSISAFYTKNTMQFYFKKGSLLTFYAFFNGWNVLSGSWKWQRSLLLLFFVKYFNFCLLTKLNKAIISWISDLSDEKIRVSASKEFSKEFNSL